MEKIIKTSKIFSILFTSLMFIFPALILILWSQILPDSFSYKYVPQEIHLRTIPFNLRTYAMLLSMIPTTIMVFCFYYISNLFKLYANAQFFDIKSIKLVKMIGVTLALSAISWIIVQPILTYVLSLNLPSEERLMTIGFDSGDISNLIIGGILILVSWIINEARKNAEEVALTI